MKRVLIVGDSRKMRGGVSTVIKSMEQDPIWQKYHCHWLQCQINKGIVWKLLYFIWGLLSALVRVPMYGIIHFHTTPGPGMKVVLPIFLYALLWQKKIILHLHMGNQMRDYKDDKLFRWVMSKADQIIVLGKTWRDFLVKEMGVRTPVEFLYNPVGASAMKDPSSSLRMTNRQKYFLFAAFFNINKGYDVLLKAFARVVKKYPEWKLVMCGVGDTDEVKHYIAENHVEDNVELPGWVEAEQRDEYFQHAAAYCMTSRQEGLPMSVLESLAMGVPVISTPVGCLPEFLTTDENVLFFDFENANQLELQMIRVIEDTDLCEHLAKNGREVIELSFTPEKVFGKLDRTYTII